MGKPYYYLASMLTLKTKESTQQKGKRQELIQRDFLMSP